MAYKAAQFKAPAAAPVQYWPEKPKLLNGGLNLTDIEWKLDENQTPKVENMWFKDGELGKRYGQEYLNDAESVELICYSAYKYPFFNYYVKHCGTKLYKQSVSTGNATAIYSGLSAAKGSFFKFNNILYYKQAGKYVQISDSLVATDVVPYIPTVIINRTPSGGGDTNEDYNRIGAGFRNSFNGNNSTQAYQLTDTGLDATEVTATVGGSALVEDTDFTVDRSTGIVTFNSAPASGTNNVIITAYKTNQTDIDTVLDSLYSIPFGGQNDNRLFVGGGNGGYYYWTGITTAGVDPTYFPFNNYNIIGMTDEPIYGFGIQYDTLCVFKQREIYGVTYSFNGTTGVFNSFPVNAQIGCDCPDSIQVINNNLTWLNSTIGVCTLVGTAVKEDRNIFQISRNINPRLLTEDDLTEATSADHEGKYWLCVGDKVYLWDYFTAPYYDTGNPDDSAARLSWWYFTNINAAAFIMNGQDLLYCKRDSGLTVYFYPEFYDFGAAIPAAYRYPYREMGGGLYEFNLVKGFIGVRGDTRTSFTATYFTSDDPSGDAITESVAVGSFDWPTFSWDAFTWAVMGPKYTCVLMPGQKGIQYFAAEFSNTVSGRDMNLSSIAWTYRVTKLIK